MEAPATATLQLPPQPEIKQALGPWPFPKAPPLGLESVEALQRRQTPACSTSAPPGQLGPQQQHLSLLPQWRQGPTSYLATSSSLCPDTPPLQALFLQKALVQQSPCCQTTACSQTRTQRLLSHCYARANCPSEMDDNWHLPLVALPPVLLVRDLHATRRGLEAPPPYSSPSGPGATEREPRILCLLLFWDCCVA